MAETKKSNLALVAARAGVSVASVSRVLNGGSASEQLAKRVREAADELGYVPDASARTMRTGRTDQITLAVADVGNPVYVQMMRTVTGIVAKAGYRLVVSSTGADPKDQIDLVRSLNRGYADGLLISPLRITPDLVEALSASRLPIVVIGTLPPEVELDNVRADSATGIGLAVEHLIAQGRRRIALVNGPVDTVPGSARLAGHRAALERFGLAASDELEVTATGFTYRAGHRATARLLAQAEPDAIIGANDLLAVGALKELAAAGRRVPEDVAVVGMDDTDAAELATPSLTSVDLGSAKRAKAAAKLLIRRIEDPDAPVVRQVIAPALSVRESTVPEAPRA
ncbi:LacI family DNA-binding transcriptional regulator [Glycomyces paridis]|uniref:LacI family transcriptional regulator n=1 Tax=Glycomyces paridis TaxID=2126555 RepID=A0A4S8PAL3_9ACTN|nr:LacI family DNA-binding transcriptional regulator [Glycomyces paridis]THV27300.1 LacI family transcriptional regulator [Glycomyces paridis]